MVGCGFAQPQSGLHVRSVGLEPATFRFVVNLCRYLQAPRATHRAPQKADSAPGVARLTRTGPPENSTHKWSNKWSGTSRERNSPFFEPNLVRLVKCPR